MPGGVPLLTSLPAWPYEPGTLLAFDIETTGLSPTDDRVVLLAISDGTTHLAIDLRHSTEPVGEWIRSHLWQHPVVGHNVAFDMAFLQQHFDCGYPDMPWCTRVAEQLAYAGIPQGSSLAELFLRYFNITLDKTLQTSFTMEGEISQAQVDYAVSDVAMLTRIVERQQSVIDADGLNETWDLERRCIAPFAEMFRGGVYVDLERLTPLLNNARREMNDREIELNLKLIPFADWWRDFDFQAATRELNAYLDRVQSETERLRDEWHDQIDNPPDPAEWAEHKWDDQSTAKGKTEPAGCGRYITHGLKAWRAVNKRPVKPKRDWGELNLRSGEQVIQTLANMGLHLDNYKAETLESLVGQVEPEHRAILQGILSHKEFSKLNSSFGDRLIARRDSNGIVHGNFNQYGTSTGRPSCSDPNMLQMPREDSFRACFRARPGHLFVICDYSQMELRIMAELSRDRRMIEAFRNDQDLHTVSAARYFTNDDLEAVTKEQRATGKTVNFLIQYGGGKKTLKNNLALKNQYYSLEECQGFIDQWNTLFSGVARWRRGQEEFFREHGYTETFTGRKRFFRTRGLNYWDLQGLARQAANHPIQGGNADCTKMALAAIHELIYPVGQIRLNVYDEIVIEVPEDQAEAAATVVVQAMKTAAEMVLQHVPVKVDATISPSWSEQEGTPVGE